MRDPHEYGSARPRRERYNSAARRTAFRQEQPLTQHNARSSDHAAVVIPPPLIFIGPLLAGFILQRETPWPISDRWSLLIAVAAAAFSIAVLLGLTAVATFKRRGTTVLPAWRPTRTIVTTGPYRFTRNPMYVAMALVYVGLSLAFNTLWPLILLPIALLVVDRYVIAREERYLSAKFGAAYETYRRRVRRWL
jgi:protein-S-isoprenylcysteine O-methyltransferase Ste14